MDYIDYPLHRIKLIEFLLPESHNSHLHYSGLQSFRKNVLHNNSQSKNQVQNQHSGINQSYPQEKNDTTMQSQQYLFQDKLVENFL